MGLLLALTPTLAVEAGNLDEFGLGARASAMGGAFTAFSSGPESAYYNPAGLINSEHINLQTGFSYVDYHLRFNSQAGQLDSEAERIDPLSGYTIGFSTTVPFRDEPHRFGVGLVVFLPTRKIVTVTARAPTSRPEFAQYGDRQDRLQAYLAGAVKVTDWLRLGAGAQIFADATGRADVDTVGGVGASQFELDLAGDVAPVAGIYLLPLDNLSFGLTYRGEISLKLDFDVTAFGAIAAATLEAITLFSPNQVAAGFSYNPNDSFFIAFDLTYFQWSAFQDPFLSNNGARETLRLKDTVVPRLGVEFLATDSLALRAGYFYRPTPIPTQDRNRNLIDSNKHVFTAGVGYTFSFDNPNLRQKTPPEAEPEPVTATLNIFAQLHWHENLSVNKNVAAPAGDPVGNDFTTGGTITSFGFDFVVRF